MSRKKFLVLYYYIYVYVKKRKKESLCRDDTRK